MIMRARHHPVDLFGRRRHAARTAPISSFSCSSCTRAARAAPGFVKIHRETTRARVQAHEKRPPERRRQRAATVVVVIMVSYETPTVVILADSSPENGRSTEITTTIDRFSPAECSGLATRHYYSRSGF